MTNGEKIVKVSFHLSRSFLHSSFSNKLPRPSFHFFFVVILLFRSGWLLEWHFFVFYLLALDFGKGKSIHIWTYDRDQKSSTMMTIIIMIPVFNFEGFDDDLSSISFQFEGHLSNFSPDL